MTIIRDRHASDLAEKALSEDSRRFEKIPEDSRSGKEEEEVGRHRGGTQDNVFKKKKCGVVVTLDTLRALPENQEVTLYLDVVSTPTSPKMCTNHKNNNNNQNHNNNNNRRLLQASKDSLSQSRSSHPDPGAKDCCPREEKEDNKQQCIQIKSPPPQGGGEWQGGNCGHAERVCDCEEAKGGSQTIPEDSRRFQNYGGGSCRRGCCCLSSSSSSYIQRKSSGRSNQS
jgi:hypothetical protein